MSLLDIAGGKIPARTVLSEYHGMGTTTGAFAIRNGRWKYVHYAKYAPQLFDLEADPDEIVDLAGDPKHVGVLAECRAKLYAICDPDEVDRSAKARQAELLSQGVEPVGDTTPEFAAFLKSEFDAYSKIARERNIRATD